MEWQSCREQHHVGVAASRPLTCAAVIFKIQQVSASSVRALVQRLKNRHLLQEPGQHVELFGSKVIELTRGMQGSGLAPTDLFSVVAGCFIDCDVLAFKLKALGFFDAVDDNGSTMKHLDVRRPGRVDEVIAVMNPNSGLCGVICHRAMEELEKLLSNSPMVSKPKPRHGNASCT
jgi:hypothetical protein